jgi:hypothetical protein
MKKKNPIKSVIFLDDISGDQITDALSVHSSLSVQVTVLAQSDHRMPCGPRVNSRLTRSLHPEQAGVFEDLSG